MIGRMFAHMSREEWVFRGLAIVMILAMVGLIVMPAVGECKLGVALALKGNGAGAAGSALVGAGLIRVSPEIGMFLVEAGLASSSTGFGIAAGGFLMGVGFAL